MVAQGLRPEGPWDAASLTPGPADPRPSAVAPAPTLLPRPRSYQAAARRPPRPRPRARRAPRRHARPPGIPPRGGRGRRATSSAPTRPACVTGGPPWRSCGIRPRAGRGRRAEPWPACRIEDWPDFAVRGVMLDVSRDRVPTMQTLRDLVDRLAGWKINQLQLYMEHTFAYAGHEDVWRRRRPLHAPTTCTTSTPTAARGGWSSWPTRTLWGTSSDGCAWSGTGPWPSPPTASTGCSASTAPPSPSTPPIPTPSPSSRTSSPSSSRRCAPRGCTSAWTSPGSSAPSDAVSGCSGCAPCATSRSSADASCSCGATYRRAHPELLARAPRRASPCASGDTRATTPSTERAARLEEAGVPFWVCPGTSSWMSISGRIDNMIENIRAAAARRGRPRRAAGSSSPTGATWATISNRV